MRSLMLPLVLVIVGGAFLVVGLSQTSFELFPPEPITIRASDAVPPSAAVSRAPATPRATFPSIGGVSERGDRPTRVPTRVVITDLGIDLPIIGQPGSPTSYPPCNVAMYLRALSSPGQEGATYVYAHAREGMFLPMLDASKIDNGRAMLGMTVRLYTSDDQLFTYRVTEVHRHVPTLAPALAARDEELWLQTSEGPSGTVGKLELVAEPVAVAPASAEDARPKPHPVDCE